MHEMSDPVFWGKYANYFNMSSAENSIQNAKRKLARRTQKHFHENWNFPIFLSEWP